MGEIILTTIWMCIGVAFYLVAVGAVTSSIVSQQSSGDELEVSLSFSELFFRKN